MKKSILILIAIVLFVVSHKVLIEIYPNATTDYEEFLKYYYAKEKVNEVLFCLLFFILYMSVKCRLFSAFAMFGFTLTFCSVLDKVVFHNYNYLATDMIVVAIALILSIKVYKHGKYPSRSKGIIH